MKKLSPPPPEKKKKHAHRHTCAPSQDFAKKYMREISIAMF